MRVVCKACGFQYSTFVEYSSCPNCLSENVEEDLSEEKEGKS